ncbi:hemolysin, partial [Xanthomonas citri pv. fuscans]|nr:hemolysin [Xanthomonas citri pv. fuscans]
MSGPVYHVEIRYDIGGSNNIPHTFFVTTKPDGSSREYGFAPLEGGALAGDGAVYETGVGTAEGEHEYQAASSKYSINQDQYESLMGFVDSTRVGSTYWAGGDHFSASMYNCTTWQSAAFNAAGIDLPTEADHAWNP